MESGDLSIFDVDMELSFRAETLPVDAFKANLNSVCGSFDIEPKERCDTGWGGVGTLDVAGIETALVSTDLQRVLRTSRNISEDHNENVFLILQHSGKALMIQDDQNTMLMPGDMVLIDSAYKSEFVFFGDRSEQISLHLPRQDLMDRMGSAFESGASISSQDTAAIAIRAVVEQGIRLQNSEEAAGFVRESLFSLLGAYFFMRSKGDQLNQTTVAASLQGPVLARAIAVVDTRYHEPSFNAAALATELGVSAKQLQRAFQELSVTPTRYLLARRLEAARTAIADRSLTGSTTLISTIAYKCGFSDLSYFNRRYREAFGASPGEFGK